VLQGIRPDGVVAVQRKQLARELVADLRKIDKQLADIDARIVEAVTASRTTLTDIVGIGAILAATIIGHAGDIDRFPSRAHFATPSSPNTVRKTTSAAVRMGSRPGASTPSS
jgi:transposase